MATLPAVTGSIDGVKPIYEPEARWCMWNMKEIFTGTVGANRYVPKVNDWVVDTLARAIYSVLAIDPMTLLVTMEPVDNTGLSSLDGDRGANHLVYLDTSVVPHALAVDARFRIPGTMNTYIKIFRGTDVSAATGKVISFLFDASGNFVTNNIPLELAELDTHTNVSIKVPVPCHTKEALADGELVTVVAYNAQNNVVRKDTMTIENTSFIRGQGAPTKYISHISLKSPFLSATVPGLLEYPLNVPLQNFNMYGVVHYSDGSTREYPVDGTKMAMLGLESFVASVPSQRSELVLRYKLDPSEISYGAVSGDGKYVVQPFTLVATAQDGAFTVKLFGYPEWVTATASYTMRWFMLDLTRQTLFDATAAVRYNANTAAFDPALMNAAQNLSVHVNLRDVSGIFKPYIHTQTLTVILKEPGTVVTPVTHWLVATDSGQNPYYGEGIYARASMVNANLWKVRLGSGKTTQTEWLAALYADSKPLIDRNVETKAPTPTHFRVFNGTQSLEFPIASWNDELALNFATGTSGLLSVEFVNKTGLNTLRLAVSGMPLIPA